jgi:hypothetical protein
MRLSYALLALPALALAQEQKPLVDQVQEQFNGLFEKVKSFLPAQPAAGTSKGANVAAKNVTPLTLENYKEILAAPAISASKTPAANWMVLITGSNKTCHGQCGPVDTAFQSAAKTFSADSKTPQLATIDCDHEPILCNVWLVSPPALYYIRSPVPAATAGAPATRPIHYYKLNPAVVSAQDLIDIHKANNWEKIPAMDSPFHPFDGILATTGANLAIGYAYTALNMVPSWVYMIAVSFFSRTIMSGFWKPEPAARRPAAAQ